WGSPWPGLGDGRSEGEAQREIVRGILGDGACAPRARGYTRAELAAQPKPLQRPGPPLVMGGGALPRAARMAARYAAEYNLLYVTADEGAEPRQRLAAAPRAPRRGPGSRRPPVRPPTLTRPRRAGGHAPPRRCESARWAGGRMGEWAPAATVEEVAEQLRGYARQGVGRAMLQHLLHDDVEAVAAMGDLARQL